MGLEFVEIVMAVEEKFAIELRDEEGEHLLRLSDLQSRIISKLRDRGEIPDEAEVWNRLRTIVIKTLDADPDQVTPSAHIIYDLKAD